MNVARRLAPFLALVALLMPAAILMPSGAHAETQMSVEVQRLSFSPAEVTIAQGDSVRWTNTSDTDHTITFAGDDRHPECPATSPITLGNPCMGSGDVEVKVFPRAGTFDYVCKVHSTNGGGMVGRVIVAAPGATAPAPSTTTTTAAPTTTTATAPVTTTSRPLATSSTTAPGTTSSTASEGSSTTVTRAEPPSVDPDETPTSQADQDESPGADEEAAGPGGDGSGSRGAVGLIVALLAGVVVGGGVLLWRLRPG